MADFWTVFGAVIAANLVTALALYLFVAYHRGEPMGQTSAKLISGVTVLGWRALQLYIALIILGAFAYGAKLLIWGG